MAKRIFSMLIITLFCCCACQHPQIPSASSMPLDAESTPLPVEEEQTHEDHKPGVWEKDNSLGVHGDEAMDYAAYLKEVDQNSDPGAKPDPNCAESASKIRPKIGGWTYYFDTAKPWPNGEGFDEFPVCRKDGTGNVKSLGITGFDMAATPNYLYVYRNESSGDFVHWDTIRVSPDGKEKIYCADSITLYIPPQGEYMYFSGDDWNLYRTDFAFNDVETIALSIPDQAEIEKAIQFSIGASNVDIDDFAIRGDWIYFCLNAYNLDCGEYTGHYKMQLSGGTAIKTDKGEYTPLFDEK